MDWWTENLICPNCGGSLSATLPNVVAEVGSMTVAQQSLTCSECSADLQRDEGEEWRRSDGGWQPMSPDEAGRVRSEDHQQLDARWLEADLVVKGRVWRDIRTRLDRFAEQNPEV